MTIKELLYEARIMAGARPDRELAADVLLCHCLNISKEKLIMEDGTVVEDNVLAKFRDLFDRYLKGEPVAYLTGHREFYGLDFVVDKRVLTPRPESEILVENVIKYANGRANMRILDVGTGSGCIAVALAKNLPDAIVDGCDISSDALEVAELNASRHGLDKMNFFYSDLMSCVEREYDIITANLPYIGIEKHNFISNEAKFYEPHVALFGGSDGLDLYRTFFMQIRNLPWKPRLIAGEFGFAQSVDIEGLICESFFSKDYYLINDYALIPRVFMINFE